MLWFWDYAKGPPYLSLAILCFYPWFLLQAHNYPKLAFFQMVKTWLTRAPNLWVTEHLSFWSQVEKSRKCSENWWLCWIPALGPITIVVETWTTCVMCPLLSNRGGVRAVWRWNANLNLQVGVGGWPFWAEQTLAVQPTSHLRSSSAYETSHSVSPLNVSQTLQTYLFLPPSPNLILHSTWLCHIFSCSKQIPRNYHLLSLLPFISSYFWARYSILFHLLLPTLPHLSQQHFSPKGVTQVFS